MADDRKIHNRCLRSERISALDDLGFRVWVTYELAADDCGIMPMTVQELQSKNHALEQRPARRLLAALEGLVAVQLVLRFLHQGRAWIFQPDWQDYQKIRFPRESHYPFPPQGMISACTDETQALFQLRLARRSGLAPIDLRADSEQKAHPARAPDRAKPLTTNQKPLTSESESEESARETDTAPAWRQGPDSRGSALVGNHRGCFDAPAACARGICVPNWLGQTWRQQLVEDAFRDATIRAFIEAEVIRLPAGAIGVTGKRFWEAAWAARHGSQAPAAPSAHTKGNQSVAAMQRVIEQRQREREGGQ